MKKLKGYRFRIYPEEDQRQFFIETFGCVRFTYNHLLMAKKDKTVESLTPAQLKKDYPFLKKTDSLALANAQRNLDRAFSNYYRGRAGYPKLKNKKAIWQSYTTNNQKNTIQLLNGTLKLPKLKTAVKVEQHRVVHGLIKSATISAKNNTEFYVSLLCLEEIQPLEKTGEKTIVMFHPTTFIQTNASITLPTLDLNPLNQKIEKEQLKLVRRKKVARTRGVALSDSKNYQKQKQRVEQLVLTKSNKKINFFDHLTWILVQQFDKIAISTPAPEDFCEEALYSPSDWQQFLIKLHYKIDWYQKELHQQQK